VSAGSPRHAPCVPAYWRERSFFAENAAGALPPRSGARSRSEEIMSVQRGIRVAVAGALVLASAAMHGGEVLAQQYPTRPVRVVVPFPAGQAVDLITRMLAERMSVGLGQQVVVENRPGAGSVLGSEFVARSAPDGYTFLAGGSSALAINPFLYSKLSYDTLRDFTPISTLVSLTYVFCVPPSFAAKNIPDFLRIAKQRPGEITFGSSGNGSTSQLIAEMLARTAGVKLTHVPYKGATQALTDLIGGQITVVAETTPTALPYVRTGRLRALGVSSIKRNPYLPDVPSIDEQGVKGFEGYAWSMFVAPVATPEPIVERLNAETVKAMRTPEVSKRLQELAVAAVGDTRAEALTFLKGELERWGTAVKLSGARID